MEDETASLAVELFSHDFLFDRQSRELDMLRDEDIINYDSFKEWLTEFLGTNSGHQRKLSIQIVSHRKASKVCFPGWYNPRVN